MLSPIDEMNKIITRAADNCNYIPGYVLTSAMLRQIKVIGIANSKSVLILIPTKPFFYASMIKRRDKILEAIQMVKPEIASIAFISGR